MTTTMRSRGCRVGAAQEQQQLQRDSAHNVPWFADCAPSLLTNRMIRRYLDAFSQHVWPEAIKLTLMYGILGLEQQFPQGPLSLAQLQRLVERGGASLVVDRGLPRLQRDILTLQSNLDAVYDRLAVEVRDRTWQLRPGVQEGPAAALTAVQHHGCTGVSTSQLQLTNTLHHPRNVVRRQCRLKGAHHSPPCLR